MLKVSFMRVPRALEFPAVILTTALLTFTGVSALQASVNEPLAKLAQQRTNDSPKRVDAPNEASEESLVADLRGALSAGQPSPPALLSAPATVAEPAAIVQPEVLAITGTEIGADAPAGAAPLPGAASAAQMAPALPAPAPAQAAAAAAQAAVVNRPAPAQAAPPSPQPTPVSGMDFVWDQMFGSGSFAKPGNPAGPGKGSGKGNGNTGVGQVCPPGQAKKGAC